jgi:hypothetical protein
VRLRAAVAAAGEGATGAGEGATGAGAGAGAEGELREAFSAFTLEDFLAFTPLLAGFPPRPRKLRTPEAAEAGALANGAVDISN